MTLWLRPNVGAEEPKGPQVPAARAVARLWRLLFPASAGWPDDEPAAWRELGGAPPDAPAFPWLPEDGLCAWWNDEASAEAARRAGERLAGPAPEVVARVHDKAFAARACGASGDVPRALEGRVRVLEPEELSDPGAFRARLRDELARWPEALARSATLKPRIGTSGRGRVRVGDPDDDRWIGALPRLAARGGALLEPWLERERDYSVQLLVDRDGALTLLGTLELCTTPSGVYRGHRGELDARGRVVCPDGRGEELVGPACALARAAWAEGFFGPCGVDAFSFRDRGESVLRPAVELNARFTTGTVVLGLLHRLRPWLEERLPSQPDARRGFTFQLREEPGEVPAADPDTAARSLALGGSRLTFTVTEHRRTSA